MKSKASFCGTNATRTAENPSRLNPAGGLCPAWTEPPPFAFCSTYAKRSQTQKRTFHLLFKAHIWWRAARRANTSVNFRPMARSSFTLLVARTAPGSSFQCEAEPLINSVIIALLRMISRLTTRWCSIVKATPFALSTLFRAARVSLCRATNIASISTNSLPMANG